MFSIVQLQILVIAILTSVACVLPGIFLVLRGVALMSDAISHAILLGITLMFFLVRRLDSPLLIVGAALAGLLTVVCTELLIQTQRLKKDAAIGLVFPLFFSIGVILISQYARNVHLDVDMVLLGELAFAPFNRLTINGVDIGPYALWAMSGVLLLNCTFVGLFYKELKLTTFDQCLAYTLGFSPVVLYYALMAVTSITAVCAFDVVGSIVVVALMIVPPSTAYLLSDRLSRMTKLSIIISSFTAISGYILAHCMDVSIAGSIATMSGLLFILALLFSPQKGIIVQIIFERKRRRIFAQDILLNYLDSTQSVSINALESIFGWRQLFIGTVIKRMIHNGQLKNTKGVIELTLIGYNQAKRVKIRLNKLKVIR